MFIRRRQEKKKKSVFRDYLEALIWAVVLALIIRTWGVQAFKIPSGSMKPTLLIGDHLLVSKSSYGVKMPFSDLVILPIGDPERGDIVVFRFPEDKDKDFIKRIIALPGETIEVKNKAVYINGKKLDEKWGQYTDKVVLPSGVQPRDNYGPVTVPQDHYFVMGDNRDQSYDSRFWFGGRGGFVPRDDILGKAFIIYWSWTDQGFGVRWDRIGKILH
ncbi:MAG: signal peptidase I [Desulfarculaceae bacterium]|nr:signal peptidase I [Desulfarculaceae bacterium]MCF8072194.1 signal peptidase I [Desulfarculaceae bacterium]MCF8100115.1 signal peptidase I [Desulfarculaceae bacterium]MCF8117236.1 signal peptidase I [Desulfarculaceae bacterium]